MTNHAVIPWEWLNYGGSETRPFLSLRQRYQHWDAEVVHPFLLHLNAVNIGQIIQLNKSAYLLVHSVINKLAQSENYTYCFPGLLLTSKQYMDYHTPTNYH